MGPDRIKYSIILPYYDRPDQFSWTLNSFVRFYSGRKDFEVLVIEDSKHTEKQSAELVSIIQAYKFKMNLRKIISCAQNTYNPSVAYNEGVQACWGEFLVISNPECRHEVDILSGLDCCFRKSPDQYIVCACVSLRKNGSFHMWYQHSEFRNLKYHFCSSLSKDNYLRIGGFNESFSLGYGYDDNSFRDRVFSSGTPFVVRDDLLVSHLWHEKVKPLNYKAALERNRVLYEEMAC